MKRIVSLPVLSTQNGEKPRGFDRRHLPKSEPISALVSKKISALRPVSESDKDGYKTWVSQVFNSFGLTDRTVKPPLDTLIAASNSLVYMASAICNRASSQDLQRIPSIRQVKTVLNHSVRRVLVDQLTPHFLERKDGTVRVVNIGSGTGYQHGAIVQYFTDLTGKSPEITHIDTNSVDNLTPPKALSRVQSNLYLSGVQWVRHNTTVGDARLSKVYPNYPADLITFFHPEAMKKEFKQIMIAAIGKNHGSVALFTFYSQKECDAAMGILANLGCKILTEKKTYEDAPEVPVTSMDDANEKFHGIAVTVKFPDADHSWFRFNSKIETIRNNQTLQLAVAVIWSVSAVSFTVSLIEWLSKQES